METMLGRKWRRIDGTKVAEPTLEIPEALRGVKVVYVGTDSQQDRQRSQFVSVIVVHEPTKGGRVFYTVESLPRIKSRRERLLKEAWMSVQLAMEINPYLSEESSLEVHVDVNPNTKFASSEYIKEMTSLVVSQGFDCKVKPEAWAAMHVADHVVKNVVIDRR